MEAELEYSEPCCSVCGQECGLECADCERTFGEVIIRSESVTIRAERETFHCYEANLPKNDEDGNDCVHLCEECNEKREKGKVKK